MVNVPWDHERDEPMGMSRQPADHAGKRDGEVVTDPERIWLQNAKDGEASNDGRLWCADKIWPDDALDGEPTEYIRADLFEFERTAREATDDAHRRYRHRTRVTNAVGAAVISGLVVALVASRRRE